jgi:hypothetical protein|tara:strand:- start:1697 stop:2338 length:642 start_codon:yes stop_codon:yes gene_type:complete
MFYNTPSKGDDGLYFVQASSDEKCKCLVQLNGVTVSEMSGEMIFDMNTESNTKKINDVESMNLSAAHENCVEWFGKQLSERVINGAHSGVLTNGQMTVDVLTDPPVRVFNTNKEPIEFDNVQPDRMCDVLVEFAGLWFAKKAFGGYWNVVQIRLHDEPVKEVPVKNLYPEEYAFMDEPEPEIEPEPEVEPEPKVSESTEPQKTIKERIDILTE